MLARLVLDALEQPRRLHPRVALHHPHQLFLGLLRGEAADLLQPLALLLHQLVELDALLLHLQLELVELALALAQLGLAPLDRPLLAREVVVELGDATLLLVELGALLRRHLLELAAGLEQLLLGGELALAQLGGHLPLGVVEDAGRFDLGLLLLLGGDAADEDQPDEGGGDGSRDDGGWQ